MTAYQKVFAKIKELTPIERYILCCNIIGKNKTDEILEDLAKHPLKRLWWKIKWKRKFQGW